MRSWIALAALALAACSSAGTPPGADPLPPDRHLEPGRTVTPSPSEDVEAAWQGLQEKLEGVRDLDADGFLALHAVPFEPLGFDPLGAANLAIVQASNLALNEAETQRLAENGFVISERRRFPSFVHGYETIYAEDLPVYLSADSILHAVHRSYDEILKAIEQEALIPELRTMLTEMRAALAAGGATALGARARADADFYAAVALSLLDGAAVAPVAGASAGEIRSFVERAAAASGAEQTEIFGVARTIDFSQFKPRGHYTDHPDLERYFRASMWLGRIDFRLIETQPDHTAVFHRRQLEGALALHALMGPRARQSWERVDRTIEAFVGESDNMRLPELDALLADLGVRDLADLAQISDDRIADAIVAGGYGTQRISSHIMVNGLGDGTMPLSSTFLLLGQRYVVDSHVLSNVVYDRVQGGAQKRMMPDPLDVAFAALGNDHAGLLLEDELRRWSYAPDLEAMRLLVDEHGPAFWEANLYNLWLASLRALSPGDLSALPSVARTEAWGRRMLNTQLASWAELRHDTILYAKQSYTGGATCEFPDAYVDPHPAFYAALGRFAAHGESVVAGLPLGDGWLAQRIVAWFQNLAEVASILEEMAQHQLDGVPLTEEHLAFINRAVRIHWGCGDPAGAEGWYADLFFQSSQGPEYDPTVADVHTQPTDEAGNMVGKVLHVGTAKPRLAVITVDTCVGPRAYAGLVSSYFERITEGFDRLDDPTWAAELKNTTPPDVRWMQDLVAR